MSKEELKIKNDLEEKIIKEITEKYAHDFRDMSLNLEFFFDYISSKNDKLEIKYSKEKLIKLAKKEIKQWQKFIKRLKQ
tara:strand:- start:1341 stop:1577 length:237 start_codon:yes stop_codon:yes gene_type:complete